MPGSIKAEVEAYRTSRQMVRFRSSIRPVRRAGYPIVNFEYAIVLEHQPSLTAADSIKAELAWAMDPAHGATPAFLNPVEFRPLALNALSVSIGLLNEISAS